MMDHLRGMVGKTFEGGGGEGGEGGKNRRIAFAAQLSLATIIAKNVLYVKA